jgi:quinol monooxygenase YgiN
MPEIAKTNQVVTLINVFTVKPADQQAVVDLLVAATEQTMRHLTGFVSASIHKSADGARVTNYAQWRSRRDFEAMLENPEATKHMATVSALAQADAHLYDVVATVFGP